MKDDKLGLLLLLLVGAVVLVVLFTRRGGSGYLPVVGGHQYTNEETWDIEWNPDGLPSRVTIHRNAHQT